MEVTFPRKVTVVSNRWIFREEATLISLGLCYNIHSSCITLAVKNPSRISFAKYFIKEESTLSRRKAERISNKFHKVILSDGKKVNSPFAPLGKITF